MDKRTRIVVEHLMGPTGSVILHIVLLFLLTKIVFTRITYTREVKAKIMEVEELDLEDVKELEKLSDMPDVDDSIMPDIAEKPPEVADIAPEENMSRLDVVDSKSSLVMPGLYGGRMSADSRRKALNSFGGSQATERAVLNALRWLKQNQKHDGSWTHKTAKYNPGITGLGLLTFLAHGETTASEEFGATVEKATRYLVRCQHKSGAFFEPATKEDNRNPRSAGSIKYAPYWHGIATYAVSEAYGLMRIPELKPVMEKAVAIILDGQQRGGGWDYYYGKGVRRDTSILGWQVQALKAASIAGAETPGIQAAMDKAVEDLKNIQNEVTGVFHYASKAKDTAGKRSPCSLETNTGIGVLSLQLLGEGLSRECREGIAALGLAECTWKNKWPRGGWYLYSWYYITQAKFHHGGADWASWNKEFAKVLVENQSSDGHWDAPIVGDNPCNEHSVGPVYCTTFAALTLQVYYRLLPTYQAKAVAAKEVTAETTPDDVVIEF